MGTQILCLTFSLTLDVIVMVFNVLCYPNNVSKYLSMANTARRKRNKKKTHTQTQIHPYSDGEKEIVDEENSNSPPVLPVNVAKPNQMRTATAAHRVSEKETLFVSVVSVE